MSALEPIILQIPGADPIELKAYYEEFKTYYPSCEKQSKDWFVRNVQKDWTIIDCGANIGYYTILFARLAKEGRVFALEPTSTMEMLLENIRHNKVGNVTALKLAVGMRSGLIQDNVYRIWGKQPEYQPYDFIRLDDLVSQHNINRVDCIKIDVDSFDFEVLRGAENTLVEYNPYVLVELNHALNLRGQSDVQALQWLAQLGYKSFFVLDQENFLFKRGVDSLQAPVSFTKVELFIAR
jgi:FkbM family methyltransferase